ncbi:MORN repeat-containing protein 1-like [Acipenser ruthenus]|uniref:MORN repeat-containing protein 1-like n=1 Tax=Acipenser ruthenus TaxID=7906 RepID=UPI002740916B|nr:MORN repeat-containing protein 1-like [Acipenser ruthenus]
MTASSKQQRNTRYYIGDVKHQLRDGFGVYVYPNSFFRYEGEWKAGQKHGHGKLLMKDGSYYEGEFSCGEIDGNGLRYWASSGNTYSGQFRCGELHGFGVMQYGDGSRYEGEFSYGLREGHGFLLDKEGHAYQGSFHNNKKHGEGQMTCRNGDQYEGGWILDQRQGHGVLRFIDGSIYEGQWRNSLFNGQGSMIHCSGVIYEGMWTNGQPAGGASKIVIEGGDVLEVFQDSPFTVEVQLQNNEGEMTAGESGRVLKLSAGVRYTELPPSCSSTAFLKLIEDMEEKPFPTPFGFECISYPLMEKMLERDHSRGSAPLAVTKSGFVLTDSPIPEGEVESGSGSDTMGGRGAPPRNLDGNLQFSGSEDDWQPPPANQRVEAGCAKYQNVMLAPPPTNYRAFLVMDELEKQKAAKKPAGRASSEKLTSSLDRSADSRSNIVSHVGGNSKSSLADSVNVRAGEYVIMVQDVTSPPFLNHPLPPAFVLLRVIPPKNGKNSKSVRKESK